MVRKHTRLMANILTLKNEKNVKIKTFSPFQLSNSILLLTILTDSGSEFKLI